MLSKNFSLDELTHTDTGVSNVPNDEQRSNLVLVACTLLQPVRDEFGPIRVSSGFRSPEVHAAIKETQGAPTSNTSQHLLGEAADFIPLEADLETVFQWCKKNLVFGQLILEGNLGKRWIHISLVRVNKPNMMALRFEDGTYRVA